MDPLRTRCGGYDPKRRKACRRKAMVTDDQGHLFCHNCAEREARRMMEHLLGEHGQWALRYLLGYRD